MYKNVMTFMACLVLLVLFSNCDKNEEEIKGFILVKVITTDLYPSPLWVYIYKTEADRTKDSLRQNYLKKAMTYTCNYDQGDSFVIFSNLSLQKYYIYAEWDWSSHQSVTAEAIAKEDTAKAIIYVGCWTPGNLEVFAEDLSEMTYFGSAEVFLYKTLAERENDPTRVFYYRKGITDNNDPANIGAVFYELQYKKYYFVARWFHPLTGKLWVGAGESFVPPCLTTQVVVDMQ
jgi:hypothetical protein